ncbi:MAG TPA: hypothetical protein VL443_30035 [Cyclobacteriaceae bacterium]|jgi:hypothetical protein|nr:hypothetical protein [Cyclobacteriaceae bacterium]
MKKEESLQIAVSNYLRLQYPNVIFTAESSGLKLTIGQAVKAKKLRSSRGLPDMIILEPRGNYKGLCIELKTVSPYRKDGKLKTDQHLQEQEELLTRLNAKGYGALFATGFDKAKTIIDEYMKLD